jgi:hypothetical protein
MCVPNVGNNKLYRIISYTTLRTKQKSINSKDNRKVFVVEVTRTVVAVRIYGGQI